MPRRKTVACGSSGPSIPAARKVHARKRVGRGQSALPGHSGGFNIGSLVSGISKAAPHLIQAAPHIIAGVKAATGKGRRRGGTASLPGGTASLPGGARRGRGRPKKVVDPASIVVGSGRRRTVRRAVHRKGI